ncbi:MAG: NAD(P)/FAD-dependent oxidoreductase [bacterium]
MNTGHRIAIIGAGPAGIACAVQLKRSGITPMVFEQGRIGGLLNNAFLVENYPGFPDGISGQSLVNKFNAQMQRWQIPIVHELVKAVHLSNKAYILQTTKKYNADFIVVASGTKPILPEFGFAIHNDRILYEVYPILRKRKKTVVIIGSGDAAFDYALNLCRHNRVYIFNLNQNAKALELLQKRAKSAGDKRLIYLKKTWTKQIRQRCNGFSLVTNRTGKHKTILCNYLLYAIGREPALDFLGSSLRKQTARARNLYYIGDVKNGDKRQTSIAVGDGVKTAMEIVAVLRGNGETVRVSSKD